MRYGFCAVMAPLAVLVSSPAFAQAAAVQPAVAAMSTIVLPPNTEVVVTPNDTLTTKGKALKEGSKFRLSTLFDVMQDGYVLIPKGTVGEGTVTWMTNKGAFGKSGKMEVSFDWLDMNGRRIPLSGKFRQEGEGNTGATVGVAVAAGVFSAFVTGHSATIVNGQELRARTVEPLTFNVPASAARVVTGTLAPAAAPAILTATPVAAAVTTPVSTAATPAAAAEAQ
jgi:hypothetical protein